MSASTLVTELASRGQYHFSTDEAATGLGSSIIAVRAALRRLKRKGVIATPYRGFNVIIPPEYRRLGCLPAEQFIPQLMDYLGLTYYIALLSAARYHGAAHQQPQVFQVMVEKNRPEIACGDVRVLFTARHNATEVPVTQFNTPRGHALVSSPEATAFDLVGYHAHAGGFNNVATVLAELVEVLDPERLVEVASLSPVPWAQRLGYLLEFVEAGKKTELLARHVEAIVNTKTSLLSDSNRNAPYNTRWKLLVNVSLEPDR